MFGKLIKKMFHTIAETSLQPMEFSLSKKDSIPFEWIANSTPCFPVMGNKIKIISQPEQFYNFLMNCCKTAKNRVTLATLYLGIGNLEQKLVCSLANNSSFKNERLQINILVDYARGSRSEINSRTMLIPLLHLNEQKCDISLYHTPILRGLLKKYISSPLNEMLGLQHMKIYIFDETLIISGANLSNDYFTNRQDRYFIIEDKNLCDFYCGLVKKIQSFSLKLDKYNQLSLHDDWKLHPYEGNKKEFIKKAKATIVDYISEVKQNNPIKLGSDTWVFPLIQMGQLEIIHDTLITNQIFAEAPAGSQIRIATGYFNLTNQYIDTLIEKTKAHCDILMAHPVANGFFGAKGLAGSIPYAYSLLAHKFKEKLIINGHDTRIKLLEYFRHNWTYHAKGIWYYPPNSSYPNMTLIGSPNLGERSAKRDLETQVAIVTKNSDLKEALHQEWLDLQKSAIPAETERPVPVWVHLFILVFKNYF